MILKKCRVCNKYTLEEKCKCGEKSSDAHYKFLKIRDPQEGRVSLRDAPKSDVNIVRKK